MTTYTRYLKQSDRAELVFGGFAHHRIASQRRKGVNTEGVRLDLLISIAARDRVLTKALRPVLLDFDNLKAEFAAITLVDPIYEAILIGISDERRPWPLELICNCDGYFQVLSGIDWPATRGILKTSIKAITSEAIHRCPFLQPDRFWPKAAGSRS